MQMLNLSKIIKNLKKSHSLLIGSLLIFAGIITLSWNYLLKMSEQVYSDMRISMMDVSTSNEVPIEDNLQNINDNNNAILGKFSIADGGTVFLDEIGDMSKNMQAKLLRVLQEKEFESVGSLTTHKVNVRIIAATNRDLETMISTGEFRKDLYYRLNVISLLLPPLRDRQDDIHLLVNHFIEKICKQIDIQVKSIDPNCFQYLYNYNWPGNIRELENVVERSIILSDSEFILPKDLPIYISNIDSSTTSLINLPNGNIATMEEYEKEIIAAAMKKYKSFNKAGKALGLTHRTISLKCKKYGIEHES